jgi:hypothetical protein
VYPAAMKITKTLFVPVTLFSFIGLLSNGCKKESSQCDGPPATCNRVLFDNGNTAACTTLTNTSVFTLASNATVTVLHLWVNTAISGQSLTYTLQGPTGVTMASGPMVKGSCDPYQTSWCDFSASTNVVLVPGTYTVRSSAMSTCSNAGSNNVGFVSVVGCSAAPDYGTDAGCPFGGASYGGGCADAPVASTCNKELFNNGNTAACTLPTDTSTFTLSTTSTVTYIRLWENTTISGQSVTYQLLNSSGTVLSSGPTTKGGCDPYQTNWCEFLVNMNMTLSAGSYTVKSSAKAICANSGSNNLGQVIVKGCAGGSATPPDAGAVTPKADAGCVYGGGAYGAGCPDAPTAPTCDSKLFDNGNTAACTIPMDTSIFTLSSPSTVTTIRLWENTTISGQSVTYQLLNSSGTLLSSGATTKGGCDPYQTNWCEFLVTMNMTLPAGSYTVKSSAKAICANSGSNNLGQVMVKGCPGATTTPDAGAVASLCSGATAYFPFSEGQGTTTSDQAQARVGTLTGSVSWGLGKIGQGISTNGSSYVSVADAADLDPGLSDFSLAAWVKIPATTCLHSRLITHGTHGQPGHDGYALMEWGGGWGAVPCGGVALLVGSDVKSGEWLVGTCGAMNDGLWHHYAGVVNRAGTMDLYVDGVKVATPCTGLSGSATWGPAGARDITPIASVSLAPTCALCMGASCQNSGACGTPSEFFTGSIDEFAFWKRALTPVDVTAAYAGGAGKAICTGTGAVDAGSCGTGGCDAAVGYYSPVPAPAGMTGPTGAKISALKPTATSTPFGAGGLFWKDGRLFIPSSSGGPIISIMPGETGTLWANDSALTGGTPSWRHGVSLNGGNILLAVDYNGGGPTGLHEVTSAGADTAWTLAQGHSGIGDIAALPSGGWVFSDFESTNIYRLLAKGGSETALIPTSTYTAAYLAHDATTNTLYFVNMNNLGGEPWFSGDGAIYSMTLGTTTGSPTLVAKPTSTTSRFTGLAIGLGGLFPAGLYAADSANARVVRVEATGTLTPVITGIPTASEIRIDPVSKGMALFSGEQVIFVLP